jgi:hypothetical protein
VAVRPALSGILLAGVTFVALTSGCTTSVAGSAVPAGAAVITGSTLTGQQAFGDVATVDPCSITDPTRLAALGAATTTYEPDDAQQMDQCSMNSFTTGSEVDIDVGPLDRVDTTDMRSTTLPDGLVLAVDPLSTTACDGYVVFADRLTVDLDDYGDAGTDLCSILTQVGTAVSDAVTAGAVKHWQTGPHTLTGLDPCSLVAPHDSDAMKLTVTPSTDLLAAAHSCTWRGSPVDIDLDFAVGRPPAGTDLEATEETIAGRSTVAYAGDVSESLCTVETAGDALGGSSAGKVEIAIVTAYPEDDDSTVTPDQSCATARAVAKLVWPKLPQG